MIAISGCLLGKSCRYDGGSCPNEDMLNLAAESEHIVICPESMGGLKSPRNPAEIIGGNGFDVLDGKARVIDRAGNDVSEAFLTGAQAVLELCRKNNIEKVYLKEKSPSCGVSRIYNGTFSNILVDGPGVCTAILIRNGIQVVPA